MRLNEAGLTSVTRPARTGLPAERRLATRGPRLSRTSVASILSVAVVLVLWQVVTSLFFKPIFFPTPLQVLARGGEMLADGSLVAHTSASLGRIFAGFFIGALVGAPIGLLMGHVPVVRAAIEPYVQFFRFVPSIAWLTPAVIWFGIGETSKILIIVYTTIFIVIINTVVGVSNVAPNKVWAAKALGANRRQIFFLVILPATVPFILTGMRLAMGNSFATVVSAELIAADQGLGYLISNSRIFLQTDAIFLAILVLGILGFVADRFFRLAVAKFAHNYGPID
jgi:NitT/TauT family transport system permease protein